MKTTYYIEVHPSANERIAAYLNQHACESECADKRCADKTFRNLWQVPEHIVPILLGCPDLQFTIFKDEGEGVDFFKPGDFVHIASDSTFNDPIARLSLIRRIFCNNNEANLIVSLKELGDSLVVSKKITQVSDRKPLKKKKRKLKKRRK